MIPKYYKQLLVQDMICKLRIRQAKVPFLTKINIHLSSKNIIFDERFLLPSLVNSLVLTGRSSYRTRAAKSIANFGLRKDQLLGYKIDLRKKCMENFLQNIMLVALTRNRQFVLIPNKKSKNSIGFFVKDLLQFLELEENFTLFKDFRNFEITFDFTNSRTENLHLVLTGLQLPFYSK